MNTPKRQRRTKVDPKQVAELYRLGATTKELCKKFGINSNTVDKYRKQEGVPGRWKGTGTGKDYSKKRILSNAQIAQLFRQGLTSSEIAEKSGLSVPSVNRILRPFRQEIAEELEKEICFLRKLGHSVSEIVDAVGRGETLVRNTLSRNGFKMRLHASGRRDF